MNLLLITTALIGSGTYQETLYPEWGQTFQIEQTIHKEKSDYWDLAIFENPLFGKVLAIDGIVQLTEKDEPIYHEMMAHIPLLTHGNVKSVLIIGGGDGGLLREVLRHKELEKVVQVELDKSVIELSKKYLPNVSRGSFDDPKVELVIQDAAKYVKETSEKFDVILCDSNDPEGPAAVLFSSEFYGNCKKCLSEDGIFVNQNGVPFVQSGELKMTYENRKPHFKNVSFYVAPVPTYVGGFMAFGIASDKAYSVSKKALKSRMKNVTGKMAYYNPATHKAAFALPEYMLDLLKK